MLYKMSEWESNGYWHCNCVDDLGGWAGLWYTPARVLGISPAAYIKLVVEKYKPDKIHYNDEKCLFFFSWSKQDKCRAFKNYINRVARQKNFQI